MLSISKQTEKENVSVLKLQCLLHKFRIQISYLEKSSADCTDKCEPVFMNVLISWSVIDYR